MNNDTIEQSALSPNTVPTGASWRRPLVAVAVVAVTLAAGAGALVATAGGGGQQDRAVVAPFSGAVAVTATPSAPQAPAPQGTLPPSVQPDNPAPTPPPAAPGHLVVSTNHVQLGQNAFAGTFEVRNDGGSPIAWAWSATHPAVSANPTGGTLDPGEHAVVQVSVHWQQLGNGGFNFPTKVTAGGQQLNILVSGTKHVVVNPGLQPTDPKLKLG